MGAPKNLLIIGTGNVGSALGKRFSVTEHDVQIGSRDAARGKSAAAALGIGGGLASELVAAADVIFLAVPFSDLDAALGDLGSMDGKIVVDCTNPLTEDYMQLTIGHTSSAAEVVQNRLPGVRLVKAFNAIFADVVQANPDYGDMTPQVFCASDDSEAKQVVAELIEDIGYEPVDVGPLCNSRYLEPLAELIIQLAYAVGEGTHITPVILRPKSIDNNPVKSDA